MKNSHKLSRFGLVASALPLLARGDVPCGRGLRSIVALRCGDDPAVSLHCAPPIEDPDTCALDNDIWARSFCRDKGAPVAEPSLTGCFSEADGPWDLLGVTIADPHKFCRSLPVTLSDDALASLTTSESFEGPDPLAAWDVDISDADDDQGQVFVVCTDNWTTTEHDVLDELSVPFPPDGECAAEVQGGCKVVDTAVDPVYGDEYEITDGGTNRLTRSFAVLNTGCTSGMGTYKLQFAVAWHEVEFCNDPDLGYPVPYPYNDRAVVRATVSGGPEQVVATFNACDDFVSQKWETLEVPLGEVPLGTALTVTLEVSATNVGDCAFDSSILIDDVKIVEV